MSSVPKGLNNINNNNNNNIFQLKKSPITLTTRFKKKLTRVKSVNDIREKNWNDRFIYDKIPNYDSFNDKNVLLNFKTKCNSSRKKFGKIIQGVPISFIDNSLYFHRPLSNKAMTIHPLINNKNMFKTVSARGRDINNIHKRNINNNLFNKNFIFKNNNNKKLEKIKKEEFIHKTNNNNDNNFSSINLINLNKIMKLWDDLLVMKNYRKLFCVIYKELDDEDKEELYQRETNELMSIKGDINTLKNNIELRVNTIKEIFESNKKLNKEIINKDNKSNEIIINEISDKIGALRMNTVQVCKSMKKLKMELDGLKNLDKYDLNKIANKFQFDKNYLIKMKGELNFLKEGFAKYYFNINNDQTPFLLKSSEKSKINDKDPFIHLIPIDKDLKNDIMECSYYIYQELIAYQNEKVNNKILRCISPLKRITFNNKENEEEPKVINGKEDKDNNININLNSDDNIIIRNNNNISNNKSNSMSNNKIILNLKNASSSMDNNNILIKDDNICNIDMGSQDKDKDEIKNYNNNLNDKGNNDLRKKDIININRYDKRFKTGNIGNIGNKKIDYRNIFMNYKNNDRNIKRNTNNNKKNHNLDINKLIINNENNIYSENYKNHEEIKKKSDKNLEKFLVDKKENENKNQKK